jgi:hypothetical protein
VVVVGKLDNVLDKEVGHLDGFPQTIGRREVRSIHRVGDNLQLVRLFSLLYPAKRELVGEPAGATLRADAVVRVTGHSSAR